MRKIIKTNAAVSLHYHTKIMCQDCFCRSHARSAYRQKIADYFTCTHTTGRFICWRYMYAAECNSEDSWTMRTWMAVGQSCELQSGGRNICWRCSPRRPRANTGDSSVQDISDERGIHLEGATTPDQLGKMRAVRRWGLCWSVLYCPTRSSVPWCLLVDTMILVTRKLGTACYST